MRDFSNYVVEENVCCLSISVILRATEKRTVQYCANECLTHFGLLTCTERRMSSREVSLRTVLGVLQNRMYPIVAVLLQSGGTSSKRSKRRLIQLCLACSPRRMQNGGDPASAFPFCASWNATSGSGSRSQVGNLLLLCHEQLEVHRTFWNCICFTLNSQCYIVLTSFSVCNLCMPGCMCYLFATVWYATMEVSRH